MNGKKQKKILLNIEKIVRSHSFNIPFSIQLMFTVHCVHFCLALRICWQSLHVPNSFASKIECKQRKYTRWAQHVSFVFRCYVKINTENGLFLSRFQSEKDGELIRNHKVVRVSVCLNLSMWMLKYIRHYKPALYFAVAAVSCAGRSQIWFECCKRWRLLFYQLKAAFGRFRAGNPWKSVMRKRQNNGTQHFVSLAFNT